MNLCLHTPLMENDYHKNLVKVHEFLDFEILPSKIKVP